MAERNIGPLSPLSDRDVVRQANGDMKECTTSLIIGKIQIKTLFIFHLSDWQKSKPQSQNSAVKLWERDDSYLAGRMQNDDLPQCGKTFNRITEILHVLYPAVPHL